MLSMSTITSRGTASHWMFRSVGFCTALCAEERDEGALTGPAVGMKAGRCGDRWRSVF